MNVNTLEMSCILLYSSYVGKCMNHYVSYRNVQNNFTSEQLLGKVTFDYTV